jgi:hypothetical protein
MKNVKTKIMISAPCSEVWRVLIDFNQYAEWNPFIIQASGKAIVGEQLKLTLRADDKNKGMDFCPIVKIAEPGRHLQWLGKFIFPKFFDGRHEFILESIAGKTRLHHNETFTGIVPALFPSTLDFVESKFQEMNLALKARVEFERAFQ